MKKIIIFICLAIISFNFISCKDKKKETREERVAEFRAELTAEDTATMLKLCDDAMKELKAKNIDKVLASLYEYTDSTEDLKPLSEELKKKYRNQFQIFPVMEYERKYYSFQLEGCNDVKYE